MGTNFRPTVKEAGIFSREVATWLALQALTSPVSALLLLERPAELVLPLQSSLPSSARRQVSARICLRLGTEPALHLVDLRDLLIQIRLLIVRSDVRRVFVCTCKCYVWHQQLRQFIFCASAPVTTCNKCPSQVVMASSTKEKLDAAVKTVAGNAVGHVIDSTENDQVRKGADSAKFPLV